MLIIFDLDDTLINTSETITPQKLKYSLLKMKENGLHVDAFDKEYFELLKINKKTKSSHETIKIFLENKKALSFLDIGNEAVYSNYFNNMLVEEQKGAKEILKRLQASHSLYVVSWGDEKIQLKKMEKAGIDYSVFSKIVISANKKKGSAYKEIQLENGAEKEEIIVCGDRIEIDLMPAKDLGYKTVFINKGRGKVFNTNDYLEFVDYKIDELEDIIPIIEYQERLLNKE